MEGCIHRVIEFVIGNIWILSTIERGYSDTDDDGERERKLRQWVVVPGQFQRSL